MMLKALLLLFLIPLAEAKNLPLYEVGVGGGSGYLADYPAADQGRYRYILVPTFIYRGNVIKTKGGRVRAKFFDSENLFSDLSFGASLPSSSKNNDTREGMDDLDWLMEIGPRIVYKFFNNDHHKLQFELPFRLVYSTDFSHTQYRGYRIAPELDYTNLGFSEHINLFLSFGLNFGSEFLNDYFYEVPRKFVTSHRPYYNAEAGYIGSYLSLGLTLPLKKVKYFSGVTYHSFQGSSNEESPLYRSGNNISLFLGFNYFFIQSEKKAQN